VKKPTNKFNYNDLNNVLFNNIPPLFIITPFKDINNLIIQNISLPTVVFISYSPLHIYETLEKAFPDKNLFDKILKLPPWILGRIITKYKEGANLWIEYVLENLKEYCKTFESKLHWNTLKVSGVNNVFKELTMERILWMYFCQNIEKEEQVDFIMQVRDSLLPWFNYDLWQKVEKSKENRRENVNYEEIKNTILTKSVINDNDLDIVG
jgi:hypothetical protein